MAVQFNARESRGESGMSGFCQKRTPELLHEDLDHKKCQHPLPPNTGRLTQEAKEPLKLQLLHEDRSTPDATMDRIQRASDSLTEANVKLREMGINPLLLPRRAQSNKQYIGL